MGRDETIMVSHNTPGLSVVVQICEYGGATTSTYYNTDPTNMAGCKNKVQNNVNPFIIDPFL